MVLTGNPKYRWLGVIALGIAILMLVAAETVLQGKLGLLSLAIYWLVCLAFTGTSILFAFAEARAVQRKARREHQELFDCTLRTIHPDATPPKPADPPGENQEVP
jgi:membrane protein implicated in regulation of membrane protease activity